LGASACHVKKDSRVYKAYKTDEVMERHRHRYEFNNKYRDDFKKQGLKIVGTSPGGNLVEVVELEDHPWFVASQYHPEFKSKPDKSHPLFRDFIKAALACKETKNSPAADAKASESEPVKVS